MASVLPSLRLLADPVRLRVLLLVAREELSVAELQDILNMGQSRISTHLAQLKSAGLVEDRRQGKGSLYKMSNGKSKTFERLLDVLRDASNELPEAAHDSDALRLVLRRRQDKMRAYFDELAGKFGRHYVPGRSWKGLAETLLALMPPMVIADLGAGEGTFSQLLARRAKKVIAIDNSEKMVEYGKDLARKHGVKNLEYRFGDIEEIFQPGPASRATPRACCSRSPSHLEARRANRRVGPDEARARTSPRTLRRFMDGVQ
jgi:DNA-binding transcriptional ArsR family regulator